MATRSGTVAGNCTMNISTAEWLTLAVFIVSLIKSIWDFIISPVWFKKSSKGKCGEALTAEVRNKRERDLNAQRVAFALLTLLSAIVLVIGFISRDITMDDLQALSNRMQVLSNRIQAIESQLSQQVNNHCNP